MKSGGKMGVRDSHELADCKKLMKNLQTKNNL